jgi:hypothetical protein
MKVHEAIVALKKLDEAGYGELPLVVVDTRSGVTDLASIYDKPREVSESDDAGWACDEQPGTQYVPIYVG